MAVQSLPLGRRSPVLPVGMHLPTVLSGRGVKQVLPLAHGAPEPSTSTTTTFERLLFNNTSSHVDPWRSMTVHHHFATALQTLTWHNCRQSCCTLIAGYKHDSSIQW